MPTRLEAARPVTTWRAWGATDKGRVRPANEDCFRIDLDHALCLVADGMGGHNAGEVAARIAADTVVDAVRGLVSSAAFGGDASLSEAGSLLRNAVHLANRRVLQAAAALPDFAGMGTTIVAALLRDMTLSVAHVGDSRSYLYDGQTLHQLTADDSWIASVLAGDPDADPLALQRHPLRNALTNVVGSRAEVYVHLFEGPIRHGDLVLLTTDGVHGVLDEEAILRLVVERVRTRPAEIAENLVASALARGSRDNCTAVVATLLG
jgi:protein phosphatase